MCNGHLAQVAAEAEAVSTDDRAVQQSRSALWDSGPGIAKWGKNITFLFLVIMFLTSLVM